MARSLSHILTHLSSTAAAITTSYAAVSTRLATLRNQSTQPDSPIAKTKEEVERAALRKLEEAIHRMIVKRSQPDWLPLVPNGSYWVPPKTKARGFVQVVSRLVKDSTTTGPGDLASLPLHSNRAWPSSAHFFKGASHSPLEVEVTSKHSNKSEEEEG